MLVMAKRKQPAEPIPPPEPETPKASKKPRDAVFISLDDETKAQLQRFIASQRVGPTAAAVALAALREFLVREGFRKPDGK